MIRLASVGFTSVVGAHGPVAELQQARVASVRAGDSGGLGGRRLHAGVHHCSGGVHELLLQGQGRGGARGRGGLAGGEGRGGGGGAPDFSRLFFLRGGEGVDPLPVLF